MHVKKLIFVLLFWLVSSSSFGQSFNYSYTDPCTGTLKTINVPTNGVTVTYYGEINTFQPEDFYNGNFENWSTGVYNSFGDNNPCASVVGLPAAVNIAQNSAINFVTTINSLSALSDLASIGGMSNLTGTAVSSSQNSTSNGKKESKNNKSNGTNNNGGNSNSSGSNGSSSTTQNNTSSVPGSQGNSTPQGGTNGSTNNSTQGGGSTTQSTVGSNNTNTNGSSNSNSSSTNQGGNTSGSGNGEGSTNTGSTNQTSTGTNSSGGTTTTGNSSGTGGSGTGTTTQENPTTTSEGGGKTNLVGSSVGSVQNSTGSGGSSATNKNGNRPSILASSDFVGFNFKNSDVSKGGKFTAGYASMRWDGKRSYGINADYTTALRGPNITGFYAFMHKKRIDLISTTLTLGFDTKNSSYGTLALGQMWTLTKPKNLKVVYMLTGSYGSVYGESFLGTAAIAGGMYDFKITKRFDIKVLMLYVYVPYVSYYNDILLKSPQVILPIVGTNINLTKKFKININCGGAWALKESALNYTVMLGTRMLL